MCKISEDRRETVAVGLLNAMLANWQEEQEHTRVKKPEAAIVDMISYGGVAIPICVQFPRFFWPSLLCHFPGEIVPHFTLYFENDDGEWVHVDDPFAIAEAPMLPGIEAA